LPRVGIGTPIQTSCHPKRVANREQSAEVAARPNEKDETPRRKMVDTEKETVTLLPVPRTRHM
jgi:hypothetical protein